MGRFQGGTRLSRRRLLSLIGGSAGLLTLTACLRREPQSAAVGSAPGPAEPTKPAAAPALTQAPGASQPAGEPKAVGAASSAAPRRGGTVTAGLQNDWLTFDNHLNSASTQTHFMIFDPLFFYQRNDKGIWESTPG